MNDTQPASLNPFLFFFKLSFKFNVCLNSGKHEPHVFNPSTLKSSKCWRLTVWRPVGMLEPFKDFLLGL